MALPLPGRPIFKLENPSIDALNDIVEQSIVKVVLTEECPTEKLEEIKEKLKEFDAYILIENYKHKREKISFGNGEAMMDFSIENLLKTYSEVKKVDYNKLINAYKLLSE
jgi:molybdopterin-guanine dinucleotide biosynthesis protein